MQRFSPVLDIRLAWDTDVLNAPIRKLNFSLCCIGSVDLCLGGLGLVRRPWPSYEEAPWEVKLFLAA